MVMLQYPNGVEVYKKEEELIEKGNAILPGSFKGERSFVSVLSRDNMLKRVSLWDRGVYIHRKYVTKDKQGVDEVQERAYELLKKKEVIHVAKLYRLVTNKAQKRSKEQTYQLK